METKLIVLITIQQLIFAIGGMSYGWASTKYELGIKPVLWWSLSAVIVPILISLVLGEIEYLVLACSLFLTMLLCGNLTYAKLKKDLSDKEKLQVSKGRVFAMIAASLAISGIYYSIKVL